MYRPAEQKLPSHITSIAVRPFVNKTQQFGLEDKLTLRVVDEFLKNGEFPITSEASANGVIVGEITRYILTPVQYDSNLVPTVYKLDVLLSVKFLDKTENQYLWEEPTLQGIQNYSAPILPGGMTEEQAREAVWNLLARDIVKRTVEGFGSVSGASRRKISSQSEIPRVPAPTSSGP
ncbi:MAG: LPS assembly lipoprotein LptE [bacterium]